MGEMKWRNRGEGRSKRRFFLYREEVVEGGGGREVEKRATKEDERDLYIDSLLSLARLAGLGGVKGCVCIYTAHCGNVYLLYSICMYTAHFVNVYLLNSVFIYTAQFVNVYVNSTVSETVSTTSCVYCLYFVVRKESKWLKVHCNTQQMLILRLVGYLFNLFRFHARVSQGSRNARSYKKCTKMLALKMYIWRKKKSLGSHVDRKPFPIKLHKNCLIFKGIIRFFRF